MGKKFTGTFLVMQYHTHFTEIINPLLCITTHILKMKTKRDLGMICPSEESEHRNLYARNLRQHFNHYARLSFIPNYLQEYSTCVC